MNTSGHDREADITLRLLDEIDREPALTQRTLSNRLDIALGLVNAYIKRLANKGYIKIKKGPMNRVKYALTPKGFAHRVELTYRFMQSSIDYFKDARRRIDDVYSRMIESGARRILIWGDGEVAELAYISMRGLPIELVGVADGESGEKDFFGHRIYSYDEIPGLDYDAILIASFEKKSIAKIKELGIGEDKVYSL